MSRDPEGHTRNEYSKGARGDEHPIGPPWRGLTQPRKGRVFPNPGPLKGPGSLWKLPQFERKPDRDLILTMDKILQELYTGNMKHVGICPYVLILGTADLQNVAVAEWLQSFNGVRGPMERSGIM